MKKIMILLLSIGLYGCENESDGLAKLKALCEKDAGVTIHKKVVADGYYDAYTNCHHCWQELLKSDYQFFEFCSEKERNPLAYSISGSGCYRVFKTSKKDNICDSRVEEKINNKAVEPYVGFRDKSCISVEKIDKPEADNKFTIKESVFDKVEDSFFMKYEFTVENENTGEILSKQIDYTYFSKNTKLPSNSCHHVVNGFKRYSIDDFIRSTIKIKKHNKEIMK